MELKVALAKEQELNSERVDKSRSFTKSDASDTTLLITEVANLTKALEDANADIVKFREFQTLSDRDAKAMRSQLETATRDAESARSSLKDATVKSQQFESQLSRARSEITELRRASEPQKQ